MCQPAADDAKDRTVTNVAIGHGSGADFFDDHATCSFIENGDAQFRTMLRKEVHATNPRVHRSVPLFEFKPAGGDFLGEDATGGVGRGVIALLGFEHQVAETPFDARDYATLGGVITDMVDRGEFGGEQLL